MIPKLSTISFSPFRAAALTALMVAAPAAYPQQNQIFDSRVLAPFVPTPERVVERMLEIAETSKDDIVYDLGSGDGRILFTAAEKFKAKAVGIEINRTLVETARAEAKMLGLEDRVEVRQANLLEADLSGATVVTVYLLSSSNEQLRPKLERELAEGSRVVSHDFQFRGWTPVDMVEVEDASRGHRIYLYRIGESNK